MRVTPLLAVTSTTAEKSADAETAQASTDDRDCSYAHMPVRHGRNWFVSAGQVLHPKRRLERAQSTPVHTAEKQCSLVDDFRCLRRHGFALCNTVQAGVHRTRMNLIVASNPVPYFVRAVTRYVSRRFMSALDHAAETCILTQDEVSVYEKARTHPAHLCNIFDSAVSSNSLHCLIQDIPELGQRI